MDAGGGSGSVGGGRPNLTSWCATKHATVRVTLYTETEYKRHWLTQPLNYQQILSLMRGHALANTTTEVVPMCDKLDTIFLSANSFFHVMTKHMKRDCHFVRERARVASKLLSPIHNKCRPLSTKFVLT